MSAVPDKPAGVYKNLNSLFWRDYRRALLPGLPALLAFIGVIVLAVLILTPTNQDGVLAKYEQQGKLAIEQKDFTTAEFCYRRLSANGQSPAHRFQLAQAAKGLGDEARAAAIVARLAPDGQAGFAPAELLRAQQLLDNAGRDPAAVKKALSHLESAVKQQPDMIEAHVMLGQIYCSLRRPDEAEPHLRRAVDSRPALRLMLAQSYAARGNRKEAAIQAQGILDLFRSQAESASPTEIAVLACGQAYLYLEDYPNAVGILRKGLTFSDASWFRTTLAGAYAGWAESLCRVPNADPEACLRAIEEGLRFAPANEPLLLELNGILKQKGAAADRARALLKKMLADAPPNSTVYMLLGLDAMHRGRAEEARDLLEHAYRLAPERGVVANNLAWVLSNSASPDLLRALALATSAVAQRPENLHFRETKGQILLKLERWRDALVELELALSGMPKNSGVHQGLSTAYEKLGLPKIAEQHRQQAQNKPGN